MTSTKESPEKEGCTNKTTKAFEELSGKAQDFIRAITSSALEGSKYNHELVNSLLKEGEFSRKETKIILSLLTEKNVFGNKS